MNQRKCLDGGDELEPTGPNDCEENIKKMESEIEERHIDYTQAQETRVKIMDWVAKTFDRALYNLIKKI